jgi:hypothetical protein
LVNLATLVPSVIVFVVAMAAGMIAKDLWDRSAAANVTVTDRSLPTAADG